MLDISLKNIKQIKDSLNQSLELCKRIESQGRDKLSYQTPTDNTLKLLYRESQQLPDLYFNFRLFDVTIKIILDNREIQADGSIKKTDCLYYHIESCGFVPTFKELYLDNILCKTDKIKKYYDNLFFNIQSLSVAILYYKIAIVEFLRSQGMYVENTFKFQGDIF